MNGWAKTDPLPWLLEADEANPGIRCFSLRDLLDRATDDSEVTTARADVMRTGPGPAILDAQYPDGYWVAVAHFPGAPITKTVESNQMRTLAVFRPTPP